MAGRDDLRGLKQIIISPESARPVSLLLPSTAIQLPKIVKEPDITQGDRITVVLEVENLDLMKAVEFDSVSLPRPEVGPDGKTPKLKVTDAVTACSGDRELTFILNLVRRSRTR